MAVYNVAFLREQEEKKRYKGRGKYKRIKNQYFIDIFDTKGNKIAGGIAFGYLEMLREKRLLATRAGGHRYRVKIYNNTKGKWIKG